LKSYIERFNSIRAVSKIYERPTTGRYFGQDPFPPNPKTAITCAVRSEYGEEKSIPAISFNATESTRYSRLVTDAAKHHADSFPGRDVIYRSLFVKGMAKTGPEAEDPGFTFPNIDERLIIIS
jgi:hypothetical protein